MAAANVRRHGSGNSSIWASWARAGSAKQEKLATENFVQGSNGHWSMKQSWAAATVSRKRRPLSDDWSRRNAEARQQ
jgi:hypothetical protein